VLSNHKIPNVLRSRVALLYLALVVIVFVALGSAIYSQAQSGSDSAITCSSASGLDDGLGDDIAESATGDADENCSIPDDEAQGDDTNSTNAQNNDEAQDANATANADSNDAQSLTPQANLEVQSDISGTEATYTTIGNHTFTTTQAGYYRVNAWGAAGGGVRTATGTNALYTPALTTLNFDTSELPIGLGVSVGGRGGKSTGLIYLNAGTTLYISVGDTGKTQGTTAEACTGKTPSKAAGGTGGWGGDSNGGQGGKEHFDANGKSKGSCSGGGGGASDVRLGGTALANRILVAGGGGGAGRTIIPNPGGKGGCETGTYGNGYSSSNGCQGYKEDSPYKGNFGERTDSISMGVDGNDGVVNCSGSWCDGGSGGGGGGYRGGTTETRPAGTNYTSSSGGGGSGYAKTGADNPGVQTGSFLNVAKGTESAAEITGGSNIRGAAGKVIVTRVPFVPENSTVVFDVADSSTHTEGVISTYTVTDGSNNGLDIDIKRHCIAESSAVGETASDCDPGTTSSSTYTSGATIPYTFKPGYDYVVCAKTHNIDGWSSTACVHKKIYSAPSVPLTSTLTASTSVQGRLDAQLTVASIAGTVANGGAALTKARFGVSDCTNEPSTWKEVAITSTTATSNFTGLTPQTEYCLYSQVQNDKPSASDWSGWKKSSALVAPSFPTVHENTLTYLIGSDLSGGKPDPTDPTTWGNSPANGSPLSPSPIQIWGGAAYEDLDIATNYKNGTAYNASCPTGCWTVEQNAGWTELQNAITSHTTGDEFKVIVKAKDGSGSETSQQVIWTILAGSFSQIESSLYKTDWAGVESLQTGKNVIANRQMRVKLNNTTEMQHLASLDGLGISCDWFISDSVAEENFDFSSPAQSTNCLSALTNGGNLASAVGTTFTPSSILDLGKNVVLRLTLTATGFPSTTYNGISIKTIGLDQYTWDRSDSSTQGTHTYPQGGVTLDLVGINSSNFKIGGTLTGEGYLLPDQILAAYKAGPLPPDSIYCELWKDADGSDTDHTVSDAWTDNCGLDTIRSQIAGQLSGIGTTEIKIGDQVIFDSHGYLRLNPYTFDQSWSPAGVNYFTKVVVTPHLPEFNNAADTLQGNWTQLSNGVISIEDHSIRVATSLNTDTDDAGIAVHLNPNPLSLSGTVKVVCKIEVNTNVDNDVVSGVTSTVVENDPCDNLTPETPNSAFVNQTVSINALKAVSGLADGTGAFRLVVTTEGARGYTDRTYAETYVSSWKSLGKSSYINFSATGGLTSYQVDVPKVVKITIPVDGVDPDANKFYNESNYSCYVSYDTSATEFAALTYDTSDTLTGKGLATVYIGTDINGDGGTRIGSGTPLCGNWTAAEKAAGARYVKIIPGQNVAGSVLADHYFGVHFTVSDSLGLASQTFGPKTIERSGIVANANFGNIGMASDPLSFHKVIGEITPAWPAALTIPGGDVTCGLEVADSASGTTGTGVTLYTTSALLAADYPGSTFTPVDGICGSALRNFDLTVSPQLAGKYIRLVVQAQAPGYNLKSTDRTFVQVQPFTFDFYESTLNPDSAKLVLSGNNTINVDKTTTFSAFVPGPNPNSLSALHGKINCELWVSDYAGGVVPPSGTPNHILLSSDPASGAAYTTSWNSCSSSSENIGEKVSFDFKPTADLLGKYVWLHVTWSADGYETASQGGAWKQILESSLGEASFPQNPVFEAYQNTDTAYIGVSWGNPNLSGATLSSPGDSASTNGADVGTPTFYYTNDGTNYQGTQITADDARIEGWNIEPLGTLAGKFIYARFDITKDGYTTLNARTDAVNVAYSNVFLPEFPWPGGECINATPSSLSALDLYPQLSCPGGQIPAPAVPCVIITKTGLCEDGSNPADHVLNHPQFLKENKQATTSLTIDNDFIAHYGANNLSISSLWFVDGTLATDAGLVEVNKTASPQNTGSKTIYAHKPTAKSAAVGYNISVIYFIEVDGINTPLIFTSADMLVLSDVDNRPGGVCEIAGVEHPEIGTMEECNAGGGTWTPSLVPPPAAPQGKCIINDEVSLDVFNEEDCENAGGEWDPVIEFPGDGSTDPWPCFEGYVAYNGKCWKFGTTVGGTNDPDSNPAYQPPLAVPDVIRPERPIEPDGTVPGKCVPSSIYSTPEDCEGTGPGQGNDPATGPHVPPEVWVPGCKSGDVDDVDNVGVCYPGGTTEGEIDRGVATPVCPNATVGTYPNCYTVPPGGGVTGGGVPPNSPKSDNPGWPYDGPWPIPNGPTWHCDASGNCTTDTYPHWTCLPDGSCTSADDPHWVCTSDGVCTSTDAPHWVCQADGSCVTLDAPHIACNAEGKCWTLDPPYLVCDIYGNCVEEYPDEGTCSNTQYVTKTACEESDDPNNPGNGSNGKPGKGIWTPGGGSCTIEGIYSKAECEAAGGSWLSYDYSVMNHFGIYSGSGTSTARINADFTKFVSLTYNGNALTPPELLTRDVDYTARRGSTIVELTQARAQSYPVGDHAFTATYSDGHLVQLNLTIPMLNDGGACYINDILAPQFTNRADCEAAGGIWRLPDTGAPVSYIVTLLMLLSLLGCGVALWRVRIINDALISPTVNA
jgi:hypothetical protein